MPSPAFPEGDDRPYDVDFRFWRTADFRASATDLDASLMRYRGGGLDLGYHDHYVVDGGKLWQVCFRRKLRPGQVTGDTAYENRAC